MYTLIIIVISLGQYPSVTSVDFESSASCYKALQSTLDFETKTISIKARCVAK